MVFRDGKSVSSSRFSRGHFVRLVAGSSTSRRETAHFNGHYARTRCILLLESASDRRIACWIAVDNSSLIKWNLLGPPRTSKPKRSRCVRVTRYTETSFVVSLIRRPVVTIAFFRYFLLSPFCYLLFFSLLNSRILSNFVHHVTVNQTGHFIDKLWNNGLKILYHLRYIHVIA